jgi:hypothetical protein
LIFHSSRVLWKAKASFQGKSHYRELGKTTVKAS